MRGAPAAQGAGGLAAARAHWPARGGGAGARRRGSEMGAPAFCAGSDACKVALFVLTLFLFFYVSSTGGRGGAGALAGAGEAAALRGGGGAPGAPSPAFADPNCRTVWCKSSRNEFHFALVADLDRQSKVTDAKGRTYWRSWWKQGTLRRQEPGDAEGEPAWVVQWSPAEQELSSQLAEDGRGLELSELVTWRSRLWTFDDRTGVVFELDRQFVCVPRYILMEGDGNNSKGQKTEWATEKDGNLVVGSFGKPYTNNKGEVTTRNNLWVSVISPAGDVSHEDWTERYRRMQRETDSVFPGYMIHEAIHWDAIHRLWYVLPRRVSRAPYDEKLDETMGSNLLLVFSEDFLRLEKKIAVGASVPTHGWSSFKFVPWTNNKVIMGLRTMEIEDKVTGKGEQRTFLTLFDVNGDVFLPEQEIPGAHKYEGLEFL
jgi:soluble calcium-activated nucleotidase 1